ncbi:SBBP repeat-containing protein [Catalinimonas sp. 4WD22]|uniref:SBBP repeat-containing protein n=1 Tax=Catalinimonas locisalis TaxID=3133978 RepID=UPI003100C671
MKKFLKKEIECQITIKDSSLIKKISLTTVIILSLFNVSFSQSTWKFAKSFGGSGSDVGYDVVADNLGNSFVTGVFSNSATFGEYSLTSTGNRDIFLAKLDTTGTVKWVLQAGSTFDDYSSAIAIDSESNIYITGSIKDDYFFEDQVEPSSGTTNSFLAKYDSTGNLLWVKFPKALAINYGIDLATDSEDNVYVVGEFPQNNFSFEDTTLVSSSCSGCSNIYLTKLDSNGELIWVRGISGTGTDSHTVTSIAIDSLDNFYVTGSCKGTANFGEIQIDEPANGMFLTKYNSAGKALWLKLLNTPKFSTITEGTHVIIGKEGNPIMAGVYGDTLLLDGEIMALPVVSRTNSTLITEFDTEGEVRWLNTFGGTQNINPTSLALNKNKGPVLAGTFGGTGYFDELKLEADSSSGWSDIYITTLNQSGDVNDAFRLGSNQNEAIFGSSVSSSGDIYFTGVFTQPFQWGSVALNDNGTTDGGGIFWAKLGEKNNTVTNTKEMIELNLPHIYPNPLTGVGYINLVSYPNRKIQIHIYNAKGILIRRGDLRTDSSSKVNFSMSDIKPGLYTLLVSGKKISQSFRILVR